MRYCPIAKQLANLRQLPRRQRKFVMKSTSLLIETPSTASVPKILVLGATAKNIESTKQLLEILAATERKLVEFVDNAFEATIVIGNSLEQIQPYLMMRNEFSPEVTFIILGYGQRVMPRHITQLPVFAPSLNLRNAVFNLQSTEDLAVAA